MTYPSDVAFTPSVKRIQSIKGSRRAYAHQEAAGSWSTSINPDLAAFIEMQTSVFLGSANATGQPYIQHRGGPAGFLKVLDEKTIAFADFVGNRQFITMGNLADNPKALLFLIDYRTRQRVKIWGTARVVEGDDELMARLLPAKSNARAEHAIVFHVEAWDANCPKYIPQRLDLAQVEALLEERDARIAKLEAELAGLREALSLPQPAADSSSDAVFAHGPDRLRAVGLNPVG